MNKGQILEKCFGKVREGAREVSCLCIGDVD